MPFSSAPIRVFLIDESPSALELQRQMLATSPRIVVVGTASGAREALAMLPQMKPDVICTDHQISQTDALELVQTVMESSPSPILVVSDRARLEDETYDRNALMPLLAAGAIDVFPKPHSAQNFEQTARDFVEKVQVLSGVFVFSRRASPATKTANKNADIEYSLSSHAKVQALVSSKNTLSKTAMRMESARVDNTFEEFSGDPIHIVGIGASTGGPQVLHAIFSSLPGNFSQPILCVQHISAGFLIGLVDWLNGASHLHVKIMEEGETVQKGTVYFPREGRHMTIDERGNLRSSSAPAVDGHRPSVTTLFSSIAQNYSKKALAILLTGMGEDGARGLKNVAEADGKTVAQNESSCVVFGMPRRAIEMGAAQAILSSEDIIKLLNKMSAR